MSLKQKRLPNSTQLLSLHNYYNIDFFFLREFQPMAFAPNDSSLLSDQDTNQFLV